MILSTTMLNNQNTVEVVATDVQNNPHCAHGPTLLFKRNGKKSKEYYACSACRNHKDCTFYLDAQKKKMSKVTDIKWKIFQQQVINNLKEKQLHKKFLNILNNVKKNQPKYCYNCNELFEIIETSHSECTNIANVTEYQLRHPTEVLLPKENARKEAQFFFSKETVRHITSLLLKLKVAKIICMGTPRIHEYVQTECKGVIQTLLLDFDMNYHNFYSEKEFVWYNMFNNYIFDEGSRPILTEFLKSDNLVVLMDPPFGGRVEPLAHTLNALNDSYVKVNHITVAKGDVKLKVLWFFPYFMEHYIKASLPSFKMLDYKVDYENHSSFTSVGTKKRKFGSPVRIFTNIALKQFDLGGIVGYKFCPLCGYWVSEENRHCDSCRGCTSKDGRTYVHCKKCERCVKPSYEHCSTCNRCCLTDHVCGQFQPDPNCFHCHQPGHKKNQCPQLESNTRKRKSNDRYKMKKRKIH